MEIFILFFYKGIEKTVVAWLDKVAVCHSRVGGNPEKILLSHPEFISGSTKRCRNKFSMTKKSLDSRLRGKVLLRGSENSDLTIFAKRSGVMPWLDSLLYERLNKEVKILSFRGYDHGIQLIIS